jgi:hypothetical protein
MSAAQLSELVGRYDLTTNQFESLVLQLSPQQSRMFNYLVEHGMADTIALRQHCSIGNPSQVAIELNQKFEAMQDARRVVCKSIPHVNAYSEKGVIGSWRIELKA